MEWKDSWDSLPSVIFNASVLAAAIASIFNFIVASVNNRRLKKIEESKKLTSIQQYRYTNLYELIKHWHEYDSKFEEDTVGKMAANRLMNMGLDNIGRYEIAKPLIHPQYTPALDDMVETINSSLKKLIAQETSDGKRLEKFDIAFDEYTQISMEFEKALKHAINKQLKEFLLLDET